MRKFILDYFLLVASFIISILIVVYDLNFYWPPFMNWMEGNRWYAIIPFVSLALLNLYFPMIDKKKRSIKIFLKAIADTSGKKKKLAISLAASLTIVAIGVYFEVFYKKYTKNEAVSSTYNSSNNQDTPVSTPMVRPEVTNAVRFSEKEKSPFEPDIVILTKKVADLPKDLVQNTFLNKVITKETMFYYEDDPRYLGLLGTIRRLAYEHKVELRDSIVKYILSIPAEIALWKSTDGKIRDFLFISNGKILNKNILSFYLQFKQITSDKRVGTFSYNGADGYYIEVRGRELAIWVHKNKLYISNMHPKYFPDKNENKLKELVTMKFDEDSGSGFFSRLYNTHLGNNKHSIIVASEFLSFGYNYFFPAISAIRLDFRAKNWSLYSLTNPESLKGDSNISELWKAFPKSAAMCVGLPINSSRVAEIISKYRALTKARLEEDKSVEQHGTAQASAENEGDASEGSQKAEVGFSEFEKYLFTNEEIATLIKHPVGLCWYERSTIYTPLFVAKVSGALKNKDKIKFLFDKFVGGLEKDYEYGEIEESISGDFQSYSRIVSSKYGLHKNSEEMSIDILKFKKYFKINLSFNDKFIIFSPDSKLASLAVAVLSKKTPSISDQLKIKNKNLSYLLNPYGLSQLLDRYIKEVLPSSQESVFRTSIEKHLSTAFKNLSVLGSFGVDMPKANKEKHAKWERLKIHNL